MIDYYYYRPDGHNQHGQGPVEKPDDPKKPPKKHKLLKRLLVVLLLLVLIVGGIILFGYWYVKNAPLANTNGRTNVLIMGVDEVAKLSDTIMIVSIEDISSENPKVAMVGIPRDLYLEIPGFGSGKINSAFAHGENSGYSGGGAALTVDTIEHHFGLTIHYHAALDFKGFETIVDTLGGLDIDVKTDIYDPFFPAPGYDGYEPFEIAAGQHHMNGELALKYARSRQTTSDFDRAFRQQQVVLAVQEKVLNTDLLFDFRALQTLAEVFEEHVDTDLTRLEIIKLANLLRRLETESTTQYVLDNTNLLVGVSNEAGSSFVPRSGDFGEIQQFFENIFAQREVEEFTPQQYWQP